MSAIIIKADKKSNKILMDLAKQLGASVVSLKDTQYEDLLFGKLIDQEKTNENVSREDVFKKLK